MHTRTVYSIPSHEGPVNAADSIKIAVVIPCFNEEISIASVILSFRETLPSAQIVVCDNNSTDRTALIAAESGAVVVREECQGKGHAVRRLFRIVDADLYILVDGDATYDSKLAPQMIQIALTKNFDLVNCIRITSSDNAYRPGHKIGNTLLCHAISFVFGSRVQDILSGYKVLSRRFVKSFPLLTDGFDIETEIAVHALEMHLAIGHVEGNYFPREFGSLSKLHTYRDGMKILKQIFVLIKHERPLQLFSVGAAMGLATALVLFYPLAMHYLSTGLVPRMPTALLSVGLTIVSFLLFMTGIILDSVARGRKEVRMLAYLQV